MKFIPRLYVDAPLAAGLALDLSSEAFHYVVHVLRMKEGEALHLFNEAHGEWRARLNTGKRSASAQIEVQIKPPAPCPNLWVCLAPVKGGRLEGMIEKATELGAAQIFPVRTQHTGVPHLNMSKLTATAREAAEQCERTDLPILHGLQKFEDFLARWPKDRPLFYGDESGASPALAAPEWCEKTRTHGWGVFTGPEGGFSDAELALLSTQAFAVGISLGPRILRADTACISLCAITLQHFGDMDARPHFSSA